MPEIATSELSRETLVLEAFRLPGHLTVLGVEKVVLQYGWNSGIHIDLMYMPMQEYVRDLGLFFLESIQHDTYQPGNSDLFIEDEAKTFEILLDHESDIDVKSEREDVINHFLRAWASLGCKVYQKRGETWEEIERV